MATERGDHSGARGDQGDHSAAQRGEDEGAQRDGISSHLLNTLTEKFKVGASDADGLARFIATMLEKSASDSAAAARVAIEQEQELEKRRKKDERRSQPVESMSPRAREKELKRQHKDNMKKARAEEKEREKKRRTMPLLDLSEVGRVEPSSYYLFKSNLQQVVKANFQLHEMWATSGGVKRSEEEKSRIIAQVQDRF